MIGFGNENNELKTAPFLIKTVEEDDNDITFIVSLAIAGEKGIIEAYYPNGYKHYGIYCQNHIIDIIATKEPIVEKMSM